MENEKQLPMHLIVNKPEVFWRDVRLNRKWLLWLVSFVIVYISLSALAFRLAEAHQLVGVENKVPMTYWKSLYFSVLNVSCGFSYIHPTTGIGEAIAMANAVVGVVWFGMFLAILAHSLAPTELSGTLALSSVGPNREAQAEGHAESEAVSVENAIANLTHSVTTILRHSSKAENVELMEGARIHIDIDRHAAAGPPHHVFVHIRVG